MIKGIWDIDSIDEIVVPEVYTENAKVGIARIQFEVLKVKELQKMNEKLDKLIAAMDHSPTTKGPKSPKIGASNE